MENVKEYIQTKLGFKNLLSGEAFPKDHIVRFKEIPFRGTTKLFQFKVRSSDNNKIYEVQIISKERSIISTVCTCDQYEIDGKCKHIAAVLLSHGSLLFMDHEEKNTLLVSKKILEKMLPNTQYSLTKKELQLSLEITFTNSYYNTGVYVKMKTGIDKLYVTGNKVGEFLRVFELGDGDVYFGKQFTYYPLKHYFSKEDTEILTFLKYCFEHYGHFYGGVIFVPKNRLHDFFLLLKNKEYEIPRKGFFVGVSYDPPFEGTLKKEENIYTYALKGEDPYEFLTADHMYMHKENTIYELTDKWITLIDAMREYNTSSISFEKQDLNKFLKGILPLVEEKTEIEEEIEKEIVLIKPTPKLYFDVTESKITCDIDFDYGGKIVHYFRPNNEEIVRNEEAEEMVLRDLRKYQFHFENNHLEMTDIESIGSFLEKKLYEISAKYNVFTSERLQNTEMITKTNVTSQFTIGSDHIMSYEFSLGEIEPSELLSIFDTMKQRKKYYRLKNGNVLDVSNNDNLKELKELTEDMELSKTQLKEGFGVIPKYRAIYLDSLKRNKYHLIKTNNLFDEFIKAFHENKKIKIELSEEDKRILRPYQIIGVNWMYHIYKCGFGGILADEMGLGKSIQLIYFIKEVLKEKKNAKILIVAPTSLIYNWENEFNKFGRELSYQVIAENKEKRMELLQNESTNIYITTYGLMRQDSEIYKNMHFEVAILDEAQNIKNPEAGVSKAVKAVKASTKFALTGTPLENSVMELWSIFDFIMPGFLASFSRFQRKYNLKDIDREEEHVFEDLKTQIDAFMLRRKKKDVAKDLPEKLENNIYLDLSLEQKKLYVAQLEKTKQEMDVLVQQDGFLKAKFHILQLLTRLRQICIDPRIVFENYTGGSAKMDELIPLMKNIVKNDHKILLFTSFRSALDIVKEKLTENNISHYIIDGSVPSKKRSELVESFNKDDTSIFLIMLKAGGTGLNLTGADIVIHLDLWWNPQVENQATDRAHRIGQRNKVEVIKLICKGTIEERILELQEKKKFLSDALIDGEKHNENKLSRLTEEEIRTLLSYDIEE